jgi:hypothetical protein
VTRVANPAIPGMNVLEVDDRDRLLGADARRLVTLRSQVVRRFLLEDVEEVVVAHFEDLGRDAHAQCVALAAIEVDDDSEAHPNPFLTSSTGATGFDTHGVRSPLRNPAR